MAKPRKRKPAAKTPGTSVLKTLWTTGRWTRADSRNIAIIFVAALALRVVFFFLNRHNNPLFYYPIMDGKYHLDWAREILSGNFWGDEVFFRAPFYPYFLALLYKLGGAKIGFVTFSQHVLGSLSAVLVCLISRRFFAPRVALLAGILAALYWPLIYFEGDLLFETVFVFLTLAFLLTLLIAVSRRSTTLLLLSGALLGLSAITRPPILILVPVLPLVFHYSGAAHPGRPSGGRAWIGKTAWVIAGSLLFILPVMVRNYAVGRDIVPIASQGGVNFYIGNNPQSDGRTAIVPGTRWDWWGGYEDAIRMAETAMGRKLEPSEVSDYYFKKGLEFIVDQPERSIPLLARKLYLFWAAGERSNNKYTYFFWHKSGMGKVPLPGFWFVAPLGLLGGVLLWRNRRELSLLYLFVLSYMVGVVAFFVNDRFRLPVVPILFVFAGYALVHLWLVWRHERAGLWKPLVVLAVCVGVVEFDLLTFGENKIEQDALSHYTLGNAYLNRGDAEKAISEYEEALDRYGRYQRGGFLIVARNVEYNLGRLYWSKKLCAKAIPHLERVGGSDQYAVMALEMLGECYANEKQYANAIQAYGRILRVLPDHKNAKLGLARAHRLAGELDRASELLGELNSAFPEDPAVQAEIDALRGGP